MSPASSLNSNGAPKQATAQAEAQKPTTVGKKQTEVGFAERTARLWSGDLNHVLPAAACAERFDSTNGAMQPADALRRQDGS